MSTKLACSVVPTMEICPNCKGEMTITQVTPTLLVDDLEDVIYRCRACHSDMKRTFKRRSGKREVVTLPSFLAPRPWDPAAHTSSAWMAGPLYRSNASVPHWYRSSIRKQIGIPNPHAVVADGRVSWPKHMV